MSTISKSLASDGKSFFSKQLQVMKKDSEVVSRKGDDQNQPMEER